VNRLLEFCRTDYLVLMDDDFLVEAGYLKGLMRAMGPGVGVVTPMHQDNTGKLSYAGIVMRPDDSGNHSRVLRIGSQPQHIQTLSAGMMLIDRNRSGHVRMDEIFSEPFSDIDYGLRIWEEGCRVVCTPWTQVKHTGSGSLVRRGEQAADLFEAERRRWRCVWVETRRIRALQHGVWRDIPEFVEMSALTCEINRLFVEAPSLSRDDLLRRAAPLIENLHTLPALKSYIAAKARAAIPDGTARADDPQTGAWAVLLGLTGQPVVWEAGARGSPTLLRTPRSFTVLVDEDPIDRIAGNAEGTIEPEPIEPDQQLPELVSVQTFTPGVRTALKRLGQTLPYLNAVRPRILIGRGANLFDRDYYLNTYPDIAARGVHPLLHFLIFGVFEGRNPHPLFDTTFYLRTYPDVAEANVNPLGHYLKYGARERRQPHPLFDPEYYLERYPDVRISKMNPLAHYVLYGAAEGRQPHVWFQPDYYLDHCRECQQAARNPLIHFVQSDAKQCGTPHPQFDCEYYLRQNPGVSAAGMNPLVHYVLFGARAGRRPSANFQGMDSPFAMLHAGKRSRGLREPLALD
jgi:hypothetical protein